MKSRPVTKSRGQSVSEEKVMKREVFRVNRHPRIGGGGKKRSTETPPRSWKKKKKKKRGQLMKLTVKETSRTEFKLINVKVQREKTCRAGNHLVQKGLKKKPKKSCQGEPKNFCTMKGGTTRVKES